MSQSYRVAVVDEVPPGTGKEVMAGDQVVALFNVDGTFHALDGICPHAGGPLGEGTLRGATITCPWHGWQFDVTDGHNCLNAKIRHASFPVRVEGNDVLVEVE
jgi:nitrite reductase/ring-hydroxylating ferredoxin subunit